MAPALQPGAILSPSKMGDGIQRFMLKVHIHTHSSKTKLYIYLHQPTHADTI